MTIHFKTTQPTFSRITVSFHDDPHPSFDFILYDKGGGSERRVVSNGFPARIFDPRF